ncbi:MAG TPA: DNA translocase FtsK [Flavitalea sp.]|nr:DNA translocase FtsK [Flavitalea sp.]
MANRLKSSKSHAPDPDKLKPEKVEQVSVKQLVKDERTHKIAGTVLLLLGLFLFIAFASYLFTWQEDQDKVFRGSTILFPSTEITTSNLLGNFGAYIAHQFFYNGFGFASFLFCSLFFVIGINALAGRKVFSIWRNVRYVLVGIVFFSIAFSFFTGGTYYPFDGGAFGEMVSQWMQRFFGYIGAAAILLVAGFAYIIWRFNPIFRLPAKNKLQETPAGTLGSDIRKNESSTPVLSKSNVLKEDNGVIVLMPEGDDADRMLDLNLIEKDPDLPVVPNAIDSNFRGSFAESKQSIKDAPITEEMFPKKPKPIPEVALEIKQASETEEPEIHTERIELAPYEPTLDLKDYKYPSLDLLETHGSEKIIQDATELEANKNQIINTLINYDIQIQKITATVGPTVTLYEIVPAPGVRISRIKNLEDDIALSLAALGIRIIAPIPGKGTIGIEVPNVKKTVVSMKSLLASEKFQFNNYSLPIAIGKRIDNENFIVDLTTMPHLLMAGATGQGKSVGLNSILVSLLYKKHPSQLKLVLVDPKKVELSLYRIIEKHFLAKLPGDDEEPIITDTKKVIHTLNALCIEMDNRYDLLKEAGARNIREYNEKFVKRKLNPQKGHQFLPFIVLVIDEFADLIMTAGKEVEMPIARLAQLARAVGIHLIIATQRPSVNIITGTIKANFPARIAFKVSSKIDSRTILDTGGAEQLIGKGDMLISYNGELTRLQCAFVDTPEVDSVCEFIGNQRGYTQAFLLPEYVDEKELEGREFDLGDRDKLFDDAARIIVQNQVGSTSLLQRRMKLGYNRAGRLMDQLEAAGIVGPNMGSKARDVLIKTEMELDHHLSSLG